MRDSGNCERAQLVSLGNSSDGRRQTISCWRGTVHGYLCILLSSCSWAQENSAPVSVAKIPCLLHAASATQALHRCGWSPEVPVERNVIPWPRQCFAEQTVEAHLYPSVTMTWRARMHSVSCTHLAYGESPVNHSRFTILGSQ